jgi:hypothetical protein
MAKDHHSPRRAAEIKRLIAHGQYRVDPTRVADAMIRRGQWLLEGGRPPSVVVHPPIARRRDGG